MQVENVEILSEDKNEINFWITSVKKLGNETFAKVIIKK